MERQTKLKISEEVEPTIPEWIIWIQCSAFAILYAVWILPHVVGIRNTSLVIGSIFSLYVIYLHTDFFFKNKAIAIWLIIGVFIWATIHLVFFSQNYELQLLEFKRIWRYVALGAIFATGLGISLAKTKNQNNWYLT